MTKTHTIASLSKVISQCGNERRKKNEEKIVIVDEERNNKKFPVSFSF